MTISSAVLDTRMFPHLLDRIIALASDSVRLCLRSASREALGRVDRILARDLVIRQNGREVAVEAVCGRGLPLLYPRYLMSSYYGAHPDDEKNARQQRRDRELNQLYDPAAAAGLPPDRCARLLKAMGHTRVVNVIGRADARVVHGIVHFLPAGGAFHTLRLIPLGGGGGVPEPERFPPEFRFPPHMTTVQFTVMRPGAHRAPVCEPPAGTRRWVVNVLYYMAKPLGALNLPPIPEGVEEIVVILFPRAYQGGYLRGDNRYDSGPESPFPYVLTEILSKMPSDRLRSIRFTFVGFEDLPLLSFVSPEARYRFKTLPLPQVQEQVVQGVSKMLHRRRRDRNDGVGGWTNKDITDTLKNFCFLSVPQYKASVSEEQAELELHYADLSLSLA